MNNPVFPPSLREANSRSYSIHYTYINHMKYIDRIMRCVYRANVYTRIYKYFKHPELKHIAIIY